jgi:hypothetical protein
MMPRGRQRPAGVGQRKTNYNPGGTPIEVYEAMMTNKES